MDVLKTVMVPVAEIHPYEKNAKEHDKKQIKNISKSIKQYGWAQPIVVDRNGEIIIGHGRYFAAQLLGLNEVPVVYAEDLNENQIKALRIVDNKLNESPWDIDILKTDLEGIDFGDIEIDFDLDVEDDVTEIEEDDYVSNPPAEPLAKLGDVYRLGNHRLMCGDSTFIDDVTKLVNGASVDMVFTDPPYGYSYQSNMREKSDKFDVIENDDKILDFFPNLVGIAEGFIFICTTWKVLGKWLPLFEQYFELTNMIIWDKGGGGIGDLKHTFSTDYEVILCASNGREITGKRIGSVWDIGKDAASSCVHPTQKPVGLAACAIENTTHKNDTVLDLFGGSGSTLLACEQLNRKCLMMEYDPKYVDVIIDRWEKATGKQAMLIQADGSEIPRTASR